MAVTPAERRASPRHLVLLGVTIALAAFNLRPALASVGPVLPELRRDLGLSGAGAAALTMLPLLCFAAFSSTAPRLARRFGIEPVVMVALVAIMIGLAGRVLGGPSVLFTGTVLVGGAIAIANVLLPPLIQRDFPGRTGLMMGVYTASLSGSAAVAAGLTVPAGDAIGLGWRGALGCWALPAVVAAALWSPQLRASTRPPRRSGERSVSLLRNALAWQVTVFFGLQSMLFYAVLAWLPTIYREHGFSPAAAGFLLALCGFVQIPVTLLLPSVATRARNQVVLVAVATLLFGVGLAGVMVAPTAAPYLWAVLIGVGSGACFALALALFVLRSAHVRDTARLSAMAQTAGYVISACGPLLLGLVHEMTGSWTVALLTLLLLAVPQLVCGMLAGRVRWIGERSG
ncbi:MAG TPA: MFS transporter [Pseudonocardiaceae bacterium]|nr:MFS transporter [Pseudonocardiaceae bacterium]